MKRKIVFLGVSLLIASTIVAQDCKIISSPAKSIDDVRGTEAVALSLSQIYYENKKMKLRSYRDAYLDFYNQAVEYIQKGCKKNKITKIYNFNVNSIVDKDYYHFNATWDYN